jgi:hypothetical protein
MDTLILQRWRPLVFAALIAGLVLLILGNTGLEEGDDGGTGGLIVTAVVMFLATFLLWRFVVMPRLDSGAEGATIALVLGILAVLTGLAYWTGLGFAFGPAAVALGTVTAADSKGRAGMILGWIGLLAAVVTGILDQI